MGYTFTKNIKNLVFIENKKKRFSKPDPLLLEVHPMLVSIMTNQLTLTGMSCMLDSQLSIKVKYIATYGLSFTPRFCFAKRTNFYCIPKETGLNISHYLFWHPCNHLLHLQILTFCKKTKTKKYLLTSCWARKVDIPNNNFGCWRGRRR